MYILGSDPDNTDNQDRFFVQEINREPKIPLYLLTQTALQAGQEAVLDGGIKLKVVSWTPKGFIIRLFDPNVIVVEEPYVIVPWLTGTNTTDAQRELEEIGLVTDFSGPESDSEVINQMPDGNTAVKKGSTVHLQMQKITYLWNSNSKFTNKRIS